MTPTARILGNNRLFCLVAICAWMLLGSLFLAQAYFYNVSTGQVMDWSRQVPYRLSGYLVWGLLTVPLFYLFRYLEARFSTLKLIVIQLLLAVILGICHRLLGTLVEYIVRLLFLAEEASISAFFALRIIALAGGSLDSALTYLVLMLLFGSAMALIRSQRQQQQMEKVQQQLTQSRLDALQSQLQPHFLFNTLNGVVAAIHAAPMKAEAMVTQLARILRFSLDNSNQQTVPLSEEICALEDYLKIEQARLGERLKFEINIAPEELKLKVPPLILQPLVENAVRHGITPFNRPGKIVISAKRAQQELLLEVEDSGAPVQDTPQFGIGLSNCQERLYALFGDNATLSLGPSAKSGTLAGIGIPLHNRETKT